ncbi:HNH endonuclease [Methylobacterium sp. Leaf123]|uniref:HNH endonuclease n=1 Tax=Methylobacterium sp. Leaf123 TaxID=1736264 RepID=UPI000B20D664|nr:HNH endonuclease [Methylobacterium sp. Leaf123]
MKSGRRQDQRSPEAQTWHRLYSLAIWRRPKTGLRAQQLAKQPLCERHLKRGLVVPADTVHHKVPHKGDRTLFADPENLESTCAECHDGLIKAEEIRGHVIGSDASGRPLDPDHPWNRAR